MNTKISNIINWDLIQKNLNGTASLEEKEHFDKWLLNPENKSFFDEIKSLWQKSGDLEYCFSEDTNNAWDRLRIATIEKRDSRLTINVITKAIVAAAVLVIALFVGKICISDSMLSIESSNEIVADYLLPDKSVVSINKNSSLFYIKNFNGVERRLKLSGEAFFNVTKNVNKPFVISTKEGDFTVVGTSFNIKQDQIKQEIIMNVSTGKVRFSPIGMDESVLVSAGEAINYNPVTNTIVKRKFKDINFLAWKTKVFEFNNEKLSNLIEELNDVYSSSITIRDKEINNYRFTGKFNKQPLSEVLKVLALTFDIKPRQTNNSIELVQSTE